MKAIILAAGRGTRLNKYTQDMPKCLIQLAGRSLLEWQLLALKEGGMKDIVVVGGYKKELIMDLGCEVVNNPRWHEANMVVTLCCGCDYLRRQECIVSYSDIVYHPDIIRALKGAAGDVVITYDRSWEALWRERFADPLRDAETFEIDASGTVLEIGNRAVSFNQIHGQYMGLLKFSPAGWMCVENLLSGLSQDKIDKLDMTSLLRLLIEKGEKVNGIAVDGKWCEVDNEDDVRLYTRKTEDHGLSLPRWHHDWRR